MFFIGAFFGFIAFPVVSVTILPIMAVLPFLFLTRKSKFYD